MKITRDELQEKKYILLHYLRKEFGEEVYREIGNTDFLEKLTDICERGGNIKEENEE